MAQSDGGQDRGELKKLMRMAADRPIHMAFAFGADGKAVIKMHKMTQPKALEKALKDEAPDAKSHRFGMVSVDPQDPKVARFTVNKAVGGAARKLAAALKGTGFSKIQIVMEDGSVVEEGSDGEEEMLASGASGLAGPGTMMGDVAGALGAGSAGAAAGGAIGNAIGGAGVGAAVGSAVGGMASTLGGVAGAFGNVLGGLGEPAASSAHPVAPHPGTTPPAPPHVAKPHAPPHPPQHAKAPPPPAQPPAGPDTATLTRELSGLVKAMLPVIAKAPEQKAVLTELATDAQVSLKRGDLPQAAAGMEILRQAINDLGGAAPTGVPPSGGSVPTGIGKPVHTADGRPPAHIGTHPGNGRPPPVLPPSGNGASHENGNRTRPDTEDGFDRRSAEDGADDVLGSGGERLAGQRRGFADDGGAGRFGDEDRGEERLARRRSHDDGDGRDGDEGRSRDEGQGEERHARHRDWDEGGDRDSGEDRFRGEDQYGERHASRRDRDDGDGRDGGESRARREVEEEERQAGRRYDGGNGEGDLHRDAGMGGERHAGHGHKEHHGHHHDPSVTRKLQKARMAWTATRAKVDADLQRLSKAILEASDGDDMGDDIEGKFMGAVEPVLAELDEELSELLSRAVDAKDHQDRERLLTDARRTVARYTRFVEGNPIIADLDENPFMPLKIGKSLGMVLSTLSSVMR